MMRENTFLWISLYRPVQCAGVAKREEAHLLPSASGGGEAAKRSACTEGEGRVAGG